MIRHAPKRRSATRRPPSGDTGHPGKVRLLDADPDLGRELGEEQRFAARRQVVVPTITLRAAPWELSWLDDVRGVRGRVRGFLVLSGGVTGDLRLANRLCTRLVGPQELMLLDDGAVDSIAVTSGWSALVPACLAILDDRLLLIGQTWPGLLSAIFTRAAQAARYGFVQQAISQLPRVEDRLLALLWTLADRYGVVRADGVWLELPATHATLAQMVGARRPTVSLALHALAEQGYLRAEPGGWLIDRASLRQFVPALGNDDPVSARSETTRSAAPLRLAR